jgi:hypothetical protein
MSTLELAGVLIENPGDNFAMWDRDIDVFTGKLV